MDLLLSPLIGACQVGVVAGDDGFYGLTATGRKSIKSL
jgi:hypothetical protein